MGAPPPAESNFATSVTIVVKPAKGFQIPSRTQAEYDGEVKKFWAAVLEILTKQNLETPKTSLQCLVLGTTANPTGYVVRAANNKDGTIIREDFLQAFGDLRGKMIAKGDEFRNAGVVDPSVDALLNVKYRRGSQEATFDQLVRGGGYPP